jgi:hypothetical protein
LDCSFEASLIVPTTYHIHGKKQCHGHVAQTHIIVEQEPSILAMTKPCILYFICNERPKFEMQIFHAAIGSSYNWVVIRQGTNFFRILEL